jgi:hypothetical protein
MLQVKSVLPMPLFHSAEASTSYAKTRHHPDVQEVWNTAQAPSNMACAQDGRPLTKSNGPR